ESEVPVVLLEDVPIARTSEIAARAERPWPNGGMLAIAAMAGRTARGRLRPMADRGYRDLAVATRGARLTRVKDEFQAEHHPGSRAPTLEGAAGNDRRLASTRWLSRL